MIIDYKEDKLQGLFYTESTILLSTLSGTGLTEGTIRSCTSKKAAVFSSGTFGYRCYKMAVSNRRDWRGCKKT